MFDRVLLLNTPLLYVMLILFKIKKLMASCYLLADKYIIEFDAKT